MLEARRCNGRLHRLGEDAALLRYSALSFVLRFAFAERKAWRLLTPAAFPRQSEPRSPWQAERRRGRDTRRNTEAGRMVRPDVALREGPDVSDLAQNLKYSLAS